MSITNYFGKPRTKYVQYKSPYTFDNLPKNKYDRFACNHGGKGWIIVRWIGNERTEEQKSIHSLDISELENTKTSEKFINAMDIASSNSLDISYGGVVYDYQGRLIHKKDRFVLTNINKLFNTFLQEIFDWIDKPIWKLIEMLPPINMIQVIILKLSDVDKHVDHLEKMVASLCEDNLSLNNRIKSLEQTLSNYSEIPIAEPINIAEAILKL